MNFAIVLIIVSFNFCYIASKEGDDADALQKLEKFNQIIGKLEYMMKNQYIKLLQIFEDCVTQPTGSLQFKVDNIQGFLYSPARTTVGVSPDFTKNRKYFANMLASTEFKEMLEEDTRELHEDLVIKMKYCENITMDWDTMQHTFQRVTQ